MILQVPRHTVSHEVMHAHAQWQSAIGSSHLCHWIYAHYQCTYYTVLTLTTWHFDKEKEKKKMSCTVCLTSTL